MKKYININLKLIQLPQLYMGNPNLTIGKKYKILDTYDSNFWIIDDDGERTCIGSCRFDLSDKNILQQK